MSRAMQLRRCVVVGIGGATNSGKTTVCRRLSSAIGAEVFNCDKYFLPEDSPKHTPLPQFNGHANWDILSAIDMESLREDVEHWIHRHSSSKLNNNNNGNSAAVVPVLFVEGILVLNHPPLERLFDFKYYFTVTKEQCEARRNLRHYEPPDPVGYFDGVVWPEHLKYKEELIGRQDITFISGDHDLDYVFGEILQDIQSKRRGGVSSK